MSKIPVFKGSFKSWLAKNDEKPAKSVLLEPKYRDHHEKIRNKENMEEGEKPVFVSMANPQPTREDYERYDEDRRLKDKARDLRIARRRNSATPEASPSSDQYFTPEPADDEFVTPSTSKKSQKPRSSDATPVSSKPPRYLPRTPLSEQYTSCLSRKMEENFSRMQELMISGHSPHEARQQTIQESSEQLEPRAKVTRSSSQPPPIDTLKPRVPRIESPLVKKTTETPIRRTSYVDTLVATHQIQLQYSDRVVVGVERQMTKLESIKNLAAANRSPIIAEEAKKRRNEAEAVRKLIEVETQNAKKRAVIQELKDRIDKLTQAQLAIHQLVSSQPFSGDPYNQRLLRSIDNWMALPFREFDIQTAREMLELARKMKITIDHFRNVATLHRNSKSLNRSLNTSRKSIAVKINPSSQLNQQSSSDAAPPPSMREASTQMTSRLAESAMTQTSPRRIGVEPLDLSQLLEKHNSSSQTTPPVVEPVLAEVSAEPQRPPVTLSMTAPVSTIAEFDSMLNSISLHNESLETVAEPFSRLKTDISFPSTVEETTPRSGRVSLDSESARRLSAGLSHYLEQVKKERESMEAQESESESMELEIPVVSEVSVTTESENLEEVVSEHSDSKSPETLVASDNGEDSSGGSEDPNATQFEHEIEEHKEPEKLGLIIDPEDEQDETKRFVNHDEFEQSLEEELEPRGNNDSADDSGFLLDNSPAPRLKSIFDNLPPAAASAAVTDTPRVPAEADETTFAGMDMEEYCQREFLKEISPIMVQKAIELQDELRGVDWLTAQDVWQPPSFKDVQMEFDDNFEYFDSFSILIWSAVVDLINKNYLKFGRKMTENEEIAFEAEALKMLQTEHGPESRKSEWCTDVKMSKKLEGMMPMELDYRYDVRRGLPDAEKQKYQWQQVQMTVIAARYANKNLINEANEVYATEKEKLGQMVLESEIDATVTDV
ncbi:Regulator of spindle assembly protein 2 [Caenorhabditis elegans]|uniref:Regulator of spindle assembly protein 2 n=1 Tax=Caenorhabditis elegans TaxID=6239 RepID=RSA2_CAEEL|nr:Regulator of spindle assembly protein 2 [Caenorhabditis elegans]CAA19535.2 Regulator of spindle assembly protein 2 [Caenorhabditis elegans]|eukprot:NP_001022886.1 Regulator of spindle assembly protein 2 [Caenorhabditis elegans]